MLELYYERKKALVQANSVQLLYVFLLRIVLVSSKFTRHKKADQLRHIENLDDKVNHLEAKGYKTSYLWSQKSVFRFRFPYQMNPQKQRYLNDEINYLLANDFIGLSKAIRVLLVFFCLNQMRHMECVQIILKLITLQRQINSPVSWIED